MQEHKKKFAVPSMKRLPTTSNKINYLARTFHPEKIFRDGIGPFMPILLGVIHQDFQGR